MSFVSRLKLISGIVIVVLIIAALLIHLDISLSQVTSSKAFLDSNISTVGTDYSGLVVKQSVQIGEKVTQGETMFEIDSTQLIGLLDNHTLSTASLPFSIDPSNDYIVVKASSTGIVSSINYIAGSYVPGGSVIASINDLSTLYVEATFNLSPRDYDRVNNGSLLNITLPDGKKIQATTYQMTLINNGNNISTVILAKLDNTDVNSFRFPIDTPVETTLKLTNKNWYQAFDRYYQKYI